MNDLVWRKTPDGYQAAGYRIRQLDEWPRARWRLEVSPGATPWSGSQPVLSSHPSLREARDRASRDERGRIQRARVTGHLIIGIAAACVFVAVASTPLAQSVAGFVSTMGLFYLALGAFADAIEVWLGNPAPAPPHGGGPAPLSWSARCVLAMVEGPRRRYLASAAAEPVPAVRTLPPRPPR